MTAQKPVAVAQLLGGATQAQQISQLRSKIAQLEGELTQVREGTLENQERITLEKQIEELTAQLAAKGGIHQIEINLIEPDPDQPRKSFPNVIIQERAESLRQHGQKSPIILLPLVKGRYKLFDGELRWRAANLLNWTSLKAVFLSEDEASDEIGKFEGQIVTGIHNQKLNDLDLAHALITLIKYKYPNVEAAAIPRMLKTAYRRLERDKKTSDLAEVQIANRETQEQWLNEASFKDVDERRIFDVILKLQLNPGTVSVHIFPLLDLFEDIQQAISQNGLETSKARELNKLSARSINTTEDNAKQIRIEASRKVLNERRSLTSTKDLVSEILNQHKMTAASTPHTKKVVRVLETIQSIELQKVEHSQLSHFHKTLTAKLKEIQQILKSDKK